MNYFLNSDFVFEMKNLIFYSKNAISFTGIKCGNNNNTPHKTCINK